MPITPGHELNVISPPNSTTTPLGISGVFTGDWVDVTGFTSISVIIISDAAAGGDGVRLEWSTDGVNVDASSAADYVGDQGLGNHLVLHSTIKAKCFRLVYTNNSLTAQTYFRLQTLLRRGTPQGSIVPFDLTPGEDLDALVVHSMLYGRNISNPTAAPVFLKTGNDAGSLIVEHPLNRSTISQRVITAFTGFSQALDLFGIFGGTRRWFTVYNDTTRGNLYIKLGGTATTTDYDFKVPPRHTFTLPDGWGEYSGGVNGTWDAADGQARTTEAF